MFPSHDPWGMCNHYGDQLLTLSGSEFLKHAVNMSAGYDILHVHGISRLPKVLRAMFPKKQIILQHHGTELTNCIDNSERLEAYSHCDSIICSTKDLSEFLKCETIEHTLIENAVDTDLFKPINCPKTDKALLFNIRYVDLNLVKTFTEVNTDWNYQVLDREQHSVSYGRMPALLNQYKKFIDVKIYDWTLGFPVTID